MFKMTGIFICLLMTVSIAWAQAGSSQGDVFLKESAGLQKSIDDAVRAVPGVSVLQTAKAAYLDEFGIVVMVEIALDVPRNPFGALMSAADARSQVSERQRLVREKIKQFMTQKGSSLQSIGATQSLVVVVHLFNSNPVDVPNLPSQMIFTIKKQEPSRVLTREL
jgi:hypothetical protein